MGARFLSHFGGFRSLGINQLPWMVDLCQLIVELDLRSEMAEVEVEVEVEVVLLLVLPWEVPLQVWAYSKQPNILVRVPKKIEIEFSEQNSFQSYVSFLFDICAEYR